MGDLVFTGMVPNKADRSLHLIDGVYCTLSIILVLEYGPNLC